MEKRYFGDDEYFKRLFERAKKCEDNSPEKIALDYCHDIRKFETSLSWTRGSYFWVFIAASFTAYLAVADKFVKCRDSLTLFERLITLPFMEKIILLILSSVCFLFCLSWLLVNKGSKFWQKNWEEHIDKIEDAITGSLYKTILNTHAEQFSKCPLSKKEYNYSLSKITTFTSIMLMVLAFCLVIFHIIIILLNNFSFTEIKCPVFLLVLIFIGWGAKSLLNCDGNRESENKNTSEKWFTRSENN